MPQLAPSLFDSRTYGEERSSSEGTSVAAAVVDRDCGTFAETWEWLGVGVGRCTGMRKVRTILYMSPSCTVANV